MRKLVVFLLFLTLLVPSVYAEPRTLDYGVEPSFGHDGGRIAYASVESGVRDIFVIDEFGGRRRLTSDVYWDGQPAFTPDGGSVVFVSDRSGNRELWQVDLDGGNLRQLTSGGGWKSSPSVSLDGRVVFTSGRHPDLDLYVLEKDGLIRRLTYLEDEIYSPVWSPDGDRIAFVKGEKLMAINADGTGLETIATGVYSRGLSWSLDGRIFFLKRNRGYDLWSIDTRNPGEMELVYDGVTDSWEVNPAVSGKGDIAFSTDKDGFYTVYVIDAAIPPAYLGVPPDPVSNPAIEPVESLVASEDPAHAGQRINAPEGKTGKEGLGRELGDDEVGLPENPASDMDEIVLPNPSVNREGVGEIERNEIEIPQPQENTVDEMIIPDPDAVANGNVTGGGTQVGFILLAALALLLMLFIRRLESRKPVYRL